MDTSLMHVLPPVLESICAGAQQYGASDVILHEGQRPRFRLGERLTEIEHPPLEAELFKELWQACGAEADAMDYDGSITSSEGVRFRVNLMRQLGQHAAVLRRIRNDVPELDSLGLPVELIQEWCQRSSGIILVCGPTGSGKSTTLAAALQWINLNKASHIVTVEDPVEYLFRNEKSVFSQREVGVDTSSFAEGLRRALRQNPDVILVGEIRDALTATTAVQAAETGHLVLATLHSSSCREAMERLQLLFSPDERDGVRKTLANQLVGIVCQRLLPGNQGDVVLAAEHFSNIGATRKYISEGSLNELADFLNREGAPGARSLNIALTELVRAGRITEATAAEASENAQELSRALRGIVSISKGTRG